DSIVHLKKATALIPDKPEAWRNLATVYQTQGKLPEAMACLKELVAHCPGGTAVDEAKGTIASMEAELQSEKQGSPVDAPDYFDHATKGNPYKWAASAMPIKVFVQTPHDVRKYVPAFRDCLLKAFDQWASASPQIKFKFVDKKEDADIDCSFSDSPNQLS